MLIVGDQDPPPAQRRLRVAVAQDALQQMERQRIIVRTGGYVCVQYAPDGPLDLDRELRDLLPELPPCKVCLLGACLLSLARVDDAMPALDYVCDYWPDRGGRPLYRFSAIEHMDRDLARVFDRETKIFIEGFFEAWRPNVAGVVADALIGECRPYDAERWVGEDLHDRLLAWVDAFFDEHTDPEWRFRHILRHLIDNDGVIDLDTLMGPVPRPVLVLTD